MHREIDPESGRSFEGILVAAAFTVGMVCVGFIVAALLA